MTRASFAISVWVCVIVTDLLFHWDRLTHICVNKVTIVCSDNGLSAGQRQALTWINARIMLIGPLGTNFSVISIDIQIFYSRKCISKCRLPNGGHFVWTSIFSLMFNTVSSNLAQSCDLVLFKCHPQLATILQCLWAYLLRLVYILVKYSWPSKCSDFSSWLIQKQNASWTIMNFDGLIEKPEAEGPPSWMDITFTTEKS